jgi:hypothetical protein
LRNILIITVFDIFFWGGGNFAFTARARLKENCNHPVRENIYLIRKSIIMQNKNNQFRKLRLNKKTIIVLDKVTNKFRTGENNSFLPYDASNKASCTAPDCNGVPRTKPTVETNIFCETF